MKDNVHPTPQDSRIGHLRKSIKDHLAQYEDAEGPMRHLSLLNTPLPVPEVSLRSLLRNWEEQLQEKRRVRDEAILAERRKPKYHFLEGRLGVGKTTRYAVEGRDISVDEDTWIIGTLAIGATVRVKCGPGPRGELQALKIQVSKKG